MTSAIIMTPTEELVLEVLIARRRLGEQLWTFSNKPGIVKAAKSLEDQGLVWRMGGAVEHTFRAGLTDEAVERYMSKPYFAPASAHNGKRHYAPAYRTPNGGIITYGEWITVSLAAATAYATGLKLDEEKLSGDIFIAYQDTSPWQELPKMEYEL